MTQIERYLERVGEPAYVFALRAGLAPATIYKMMGRDYQPRRDGTFTIGYPALLAVSKLTGISTDALFAEAEAEAVSRKEKASDEA